LFLYIIFILDIFKVYCVSTRSDLQHVDEENAYLCGYLKIKNLTDEYPEMVTFFEGEIISEKHPFLTRKWDADEDVDRKHWVRVFWILKGGSGFRILASC
jgi:hypothetical protein